MTRPAVRSAPGRRVVLAVILCWSGGPLHAVSCIVDGAQAYAAAAARGWSFHCTRSVLEVDRHGLVGCNARTALAREMNGSVDLFRRGRPTFRRGWTLAGFDLSGAGWRAHPPSVAAGLVNATFTVRGRWQTVRFALRSLTLSKPGGDCGRVLDEAF